VLKNPDAGASTGIVQRYLNWTSQSKAALVTRRICGVLVLIGDIYLIHVAP
jgi:cytochrome c-type biogenesis protein